MNAESDTHNSIDDNFSNIVDSVIPQPLPNNSSKKCPLWIKHGGFYLVINVWRFFIGPSKIKIHKQKDSRFKFIAEQLISTLPENADPIITATSEKLLYQHRTIENTEARRRLERWACQTIILYLLCVFILVMMNGLSQVIWPEIFKGSGFISDIVMNVILSTTTVNIIGLGIIVLKGHFPNDKKNNLENENRVDSSQYGDYTSD